MGLLFTYCYYLLLYNKTLVLQLNLQICLGIKEWYHSFSLCKSGRQQPHLGLPRVDFWFVGFLPFFPGGVGGGSSTSRPQCGPHCALRFSFSFFYNFFFVLFASESHSPCSCPCPSCCLARAGFYFFPLANIWAAFVCFFLVFLGYFYYFFFGWVFIFSFLVLFFASVVV